MAEEKKIDKRIIKTDLAIRETAIRLLQRKKIDQITVGEICDLAGISRNAFYNHYEDKYVLMNALSNAFIDDLMNRIMEENIDIFYHVAVSKTAWLFFNYLDQHEDRLRLLCRNDPGFWQCFTDRVKDFTVNVAGSSVSNEIYATYTASGLTGCLKLYFEKGAGMSKSAYIKAVIDISQRANTYIV